MSDALPPSQKAAAFTTPSERNVTRLLGEMGAGEDAVREELYKAVYAE